MTTLIPCSHCHRRTHWPRWRKIAHLRYQALCWPCFHRSTLIVTFARRESVVL